MKRRKNAVLVVLLVLVLAAMLAACGDDDSSDTASGDNTTETTAAPDGGGDTSADICAAADAGEITIVHLTDVVGESPTAIDDFWNGSQLAAADLEAKCGKPVVKLERIPTDFSPEAFEKRLLEAQEKEPTAIIGQGSSSQITLNKLVTEGEIPLLWPVGTADGLKDGANGSPWAWMTRVVNDTQGLVWGTHLVKLGAKNVWLECVQTQLGVSGCGGAKPILEKNGVKIAGRNDSSTTESNFSQSIVNLKAANADAILLAQFPRPTIAFVKQLEENGALDRIVFGSTSTEVLYKAMSPAAQDKIIALADCNPREDDPEVNQRYAAKYKGNDMTSLAAVAYDSVMIVVDAVAREGSTAPEDVQKGINSTKWDGVCQNYYNSGSNALAHRMVVTSFKGGVIKTEAEYDLNAKGDGLAE